MESSAQRGDARWAPGRGMLTGSTDPDGCNHGGSGASYGGDGSLDCGGSRGYNGRDDYECYIRDGDGGAPLMLSDGTALSVFDEMRPSVVIWDGDIGHEVNYQGGLLDLLAHGEEHLVDKEMMSIAAYDRFEGMSPSHVVLNDEIPHDQALHDGLLQQVVWSSECKGDEVVKWDDELQQDLESYCLLQHLDQYGDYLVSEKRKLAAETFTIELLSRNHGMVLNDATQEVLQQMPKNIVWDEDLLSGSNVSSSLLQKIALGGQYLDSEKAKSIVGLNITEQKFKEILGNVPNAEMCFGGYEEVLSDVNTHESLLQKLAMGAENLTDEKVKLSVKDEEMTFDLDVQDGLLQQLALGGECMDDQNTKPICMRYAADILELKVVDDDKSSGNLQLLGEHGAGFGMMVLWTGSRCGGDDFSPQCLHHCSKDNLFLVLYEACVGQEMNWRRTGFSPGSYELKRTLSDIFNTQLSDQAFKSELFLDAYLLDVEYQGCISVWQWDPGIWSYLIMGLSLRISEISVLIQFIQKSSEIFSLQLLPGTVGMKKCDPELDDCGIGSSMWELTTMLMISLQYHLVLGRKHSPHGKQEPSIQFKSQEGNGFYTKLIIAEFMYVPPDQLSEGVAMWLTFPIAVDSRKQGVNSVDSAYMAPNAKELLLVILLIIRPWDPGIYKFNFNRTSSAQILQESWTAKIE